MIHWGKRRGGDGASAQCMEGKGEAVLGGGVGREGWRQQVRSLREEGEEGFVMKKIRNMKNGYRAGCQGYRAETDLGSR
jgi:hypothetical protein